MAKIFRFTVQKTLGFGWFPKAGVDKQQLDFKRVGITASIDQFTN